MIPIKQFLNKIKYSGKFNDAKIVIYYLDRIKNTLISVKYKALKIEGDYFIIEGKEIPLHRIREIRYDGVIMWKR